MWLYLPKSVTSLEYHSVPDLAVWSSASALQNPDTGLFAMSNGKPSLLPLSSRGWQTRLYVTRLSGTMLPASMANLGAEKWISSLPDTHASRSAPPDSGEAQLMNDIYGHTLPGSSASAGHSGCSAKTSKAMSIWDCPKSSQTFREWAIALKRDCSRRMSVARHIKGGVFSLWPTPTAASFGTRADFKLTAERMTFCQSHDMTGKQIGLKEAAQNWTMSWLFMQAMGMKQTDDFRPCSHPLHVTIQPGRGLSKSALIFNPAFSEWVMGWPMGWSDTTQPVTAFSRWLQRSRITLSQTLEHQEWSLRAA